MTNTTWEKNAANTQSANRLLNSRTKYWVIGLALLGAVAYLVVSGMATASYYITVEELLADSSKHGKDVRIAGAVDGDTINFDPDTQELSFEIVNITSDTEEIREQGGLANVLYIALQDENAPRLKVVVQNAEMPDLLQHEAQAIVEGQLDANGIFQGDTLLLKCPTRYSDDVPSQIASEQG